MLLHTVLMVVSTSFSTNFVSVGLRSSEGAGSVGGPVSGEDMVLKKEHPPVIDFILLGDLI